MTALPVFFERSIFLFWFPASFLLWLFRFFRGGSIRVVTVVVTGFGRCKWIPALPVFIHFRCALTVIELCSGIKPGIQHLLQEGIVRSVKFRIDGQQGLSIDRNRLQAVGIFHAEKALYDTGESGQIRFRQGVITDVEGIGDVTQGLNTGNAVAELIIANGRFRDAAGAPRRTDKAGEHRGELR